MRRGDLYYTQFNAVMHEDTERASALGLPEPDPELVPIAICLPHVVAYLPAVDGDGTCVMTAHDQLVVPDEYADFDSMMREWAGARK